MRPIDADALLADLQETYDNLHAIYKGLQYEEKRICSAQIASFIEAIMRVKDSPTLETSPVIRCIDCINYRPSPFGHPTIGWCMIYGRHRKPEYYCADGEREMKHG